MTYEFVEHTGDTAVDIVAADEAELLRESASALLDILVDQEAGRSVKETSERALELDAEDGESLLVDFLNELIFLFDSEGFLCGRVDVERVDLGRPARLVAHLAGETFDPSRHVSLTEVKAATFHDMAIERGEGRLRTRLVFDL